MTNKMERGTGGEKKENTIQEYPEILFNIQYRQTMVTVKGN